MKNEKELNKESSLEIPYTIRTMDSDLKKEDSKTSSLRINEERDREKEEEKEKEKKEENTKKPEKKATVESKTKKDFNPFLDDLKPSFNSPINQTESEKKSASSLPPLKSDKNTSNQLPPKPITKNNIDGLEKVKEKNNSNAFTLVLLLIISLVTIGSGFYYFFYLKNDKYTKEAPSEEKKVILEEKKENNLINNQKNNNLIKDPSIKSSAIVINNQEKILEKLRAKKSEINQSLNFEIKEADQIINLEDLLNKLNLFLPQDLLMETNKAWINLNKEDGILKLGLIFEINNPEKTKSILLENENFLPEMLSPLFIDESFVLQDEEIYFSESTDLKGVRYYNLVEGFNDKAIDWKILELENDYLLITTSQKTMGDLILNLTNHQNDIDNKNISNLENQEIPINQTEIETE